ncbi:hypothetical protein OCV72_01545, partial [Dorea amylophila]|uniref:hypothetical protein n=1 Tax=Dorea TaxID=189330 RepID=UPI001A9A6A17
AASHDLKETIDKDYCECGMPLETVRESESPKSKGTTLKLGVRLKHVRFVPLTVLLTLLVFLMVWNLNKKPYLLFPSRTERPLPR